jgi:hypothetical protein
MNRLPRTGRDASYVIRSLDVICNDDDMEHTTLRPRVVIHPIIIRVI